MKRNTLVKIHVIATIVAMLTISTFFALSLTAELRSDPDLIKTVKRGIFYALPLLIIVMPTLAITGNQLARNSENPKVIEKKLRMKFVSCFSLLSIALQDDQHYIPDSSNH